MPTDPIPINKKIPIPKKATEKATSYQFGRLEVGHSVFRPGDSKPYTQATNMRTAASIYKRKHPGWGYYTERDTEDGEIGSRLWRTS